MAPIRTGLFDLAQRRLNWLDQRQQLLAQNIANADTPGWQARDLRPFADILGDGTGAAPARTQVNHLSGSLHPARGASMPQKTHPRMPDGNDVAIDDQLTRVANTETQQSLVSGIIRKYLGLFRLALGRGA
jgi:flagellar basal-body rod protein FlgB